MAQEKIFTINLRRGFNSARRYKKLKAAVRTTHEFLQQHLKSDHVSIGPYLNQKLHERGRKNPPPRIQVKAWQEKDRWKAEWIGAPAEKPAEEDKKKKPEAQEAKKPEDQEAIKEQVLTHEKAHKEEKTPKPEKQGKTFDTKKTTRQAPHKSQRQKVETKK